MLLFWLSEESTFLFQRLRMKYVRCDVFRTVLYGFSCSVLLCQCCNVMLPD
jgi:hypothetical protein